MKKKHYSWIFTVKLMWKSKLLKTMRLTLFAILLGVVQIFATNAYSQQTRLSLNMKNTSIRSILGQIENQTEYYFIYNAKAIEVEKVVSIQVEDKSIPEILETIFKDTDVTYKIDKRQIALSTSIGVNISQQKIKLSGKVSDTSGAPLPGVTVVVKGTTNGTITNFDGVYNLPNVPAKSIIQFSFVGMKTQEIQINGKSSINVVMVEDAIGLEEVVAVGYGTMRKRDLTGSVASVSGETLENIPVTSAADAITGRMAGVQVTRTEGSPDADIKIRVRGGGSITQDNSPLYLVDGFPVDNLNGIAPTDIESIDILKDASSTAIYGARGANGVIIVTTKGGFEGEGKVKYNTYFGIKNITDYYDVLNPYEYVLYQLETLGLEKATNSFGDIRDFDLYKEMPGTNWQEKVLGETGTSQYHNLSFSGGSKSTKYSLSLTQNNEKEIMIGSGYKRTNFSAKASHKVNKWLTVNLNTRYSNTALKGMGTSSNYSRLSSIVQYRPVEGIRSFIDNSLEEEEEDSLYDLYIQNPVDQTNDDYRRQNSVTFNLNGAATIKFSKHLSYEISYGYDFSQIKNNRFYGIHTYEAILKGAQPIVIMSNIDSRRYRLSNTLTYNKRGFIEGHNLRIMLGQELNSFSKIIVTNKSQYFPKYIDPYSALCNMQLGTPDPTSTAISPDDNLNSYFGRVNYDYQGKYLASATFRADGSSKFAPGNQWGYFPSGSIGWRISDEEFMQEASTWLTDLKLRASLGAAGNNRISDNAWQKTFYVNTGSLYKEGDEITQTAYFEPNTILSNKKLKWETTITRNLGLDFVLFNQRLNGSVEVYKNTTKDLLIRASIPSSTGYSYQWQNIGQTSNKGIEFVLNGDIVNRNDLRISASFNIGFNNNKVDKLGEAKSWEEASGWEGGSGPGNDFLVEEGKPLGQMYGYVTEGMYSFDDFDYDSDSHSYTLHEGVSNNYGILGGYFGPGSLKLKDQDGDLIVNEADRVVIGNANPKHTGGFTLNAQYKGFDFSTFFNWVYGNNIYNANKLRWGCFIGTRNYRNLTADMTNFFRTYNSDTGQRVYDPAELAELNKDAEIWSPNFGNAKLHSWAIEDGSFLRLNTMTIGYSLPEKLINKIGVNKFRFYATGYNLWIWTKYTGNDPEVDTRRETPLTPGVDYNAYPRSRSFILGLNVEF